MVVHGRSGYFGHDDAQRQKDGRKMHDRYSLQ